MGAHPGFMGDDFSWTNWTSYNEGDATSPQVEASVLLQFHHRQLGSASIIADGTGVCLVRQDETPLPRRWSLLIRPSTPSP